ncbi:hypothetical protein ACFQYP_14925 [Nonomuraea antimicrobica]
MQVGVLEVALPECGERTGVVGVPADRVHPARLGPPGHLAGQRGGRGEITAGGGQQGLHVLGRPHHSVAERPGELEQLVEEDVGLLPAAREEVVHGQRDQAGVRGGAAASRPAVGDHPEQALPAVAQPVEEERRPGDPYEVRRDGRLAQAGDGGVQPGQLARRDPRRIGVAGEGQGQGLGQARAVAGDGSLKRFPQLGPAREPAHLEEHLDRVRHLRLVAVPLDGPGQQAVGGVDVTVLGEQQVGPGDRRLQRRGRAGIAPFGPGQQPADLAQVVTLPSDVGGAYQAAGPVGRTGLSSAARSRAADAPSASPSPPSRPSPGESRPPRPAARPPWRGARPGAAADRPATARARGAPGGARGRSPSRPPRP